MRIRQLYSCTYAHPLGIVSILLLFVLSTSVTAQESILPPSFDRSARSVDTILVDLEAAMSIVFSYSSERVDVLRRTSIARNITTLGECLDALFPAEQYIVQYSGDRVRIVPAAGINGDVTISGHVSDRSTGESLIGATIAAHDSESGTLRGTVSNAYGFYSITLPSVRQVLECTYLGYQPTRIAVPGKRDTVLNFQLAPQGHRLEEVVVTEEQFRDPAFHHVHSTQMGKTQFSINQLKRMPAMFAEVDLIKSVQLLPGVSTLGEGSSNFHVRGGAADQNLILLDEAPVYNPSHLMGFYSVFNQDAIHSLDFYKGNFPAKYGGRLSSVLDVRMKEGNSEDLNISGGIGTTSARLTVEGPLSQGKSSFMLSGRRTYADLFLKLAKDTYTRQTAIYFYDLNAKFNVRLNEKNRIYLSGYFGRDLNKIRSLQYQIDWGNITGTFRWNHIFNKKLFSNLSLIGSNYDYLIDLPQVDQPFDWSASIRDYALKYDFNYYASPSMEVQFGVQSTFHRFKPGYARDDDATAVPEVHALESAAYISNVHAINDKISVDYGLRFSLFQLIGPGSVLAFDDQGNRIGASTIGAGEIYKTYSALEPRVQARYRLSDHTSLKAGYARNVQYLNQLSNLSLGFNVFDVWIPASTNIQPQRAHQFAAGVYWDTKERSLQFSIEGFYKLLEEQIGFRDHSQLIMNPDIEGQLLAGDGRAYGIEFSAQKTAGRLNGWFGYTWSRTTLTIPGINEGKRFPASYDQPHSVSLAVSYRLNERWEFSSNFVYNTGKPITLPTATYWYDGRIVPVYGSRNGSRLPDYHRMDISANLYRKPKAGMKNNSYWTFSIYNVYNRQNAATAFVSAELADIDVITNPDKSDYYKLYLFGIFPSVAYHFNF